VRRRLAAALLAALRRGPTAWRAGRSAAWALAALQPPPRPPWPTLSVVLPVGAADVPLAAALATILEGAPEPLEILAVTAAEERFAELTGLMFAEPRLRAWHLPGAAAPGALLRLALERACGRLVAFRDPARPVPLAGLRPQLAALARQRGAIAALLAAPEGLDDIVLRWAEAGRTVGWPAPDEVAPAQSWRARLRAGQGAARALVLPGGWAGPAGTPPSRRPVPRHGVLLFDEPRPGERFMAAAAAPATVRAAEAVAWPDGLGFAALDETETVSIIVPVFERAGTLAAALASLCRQSWRRLEILVVDDASRDGTLAVAQRMADADPRIRVLPQPVNRGTYWCANVGLVAATGDYVLLHGSDDWALPHHVARQILELRRDPALVAVYAQSARFDAALGRVPGLRPMQAPMLVRRTALARVGFFDTVRIAADSELQGRLAAVFGASALRRLASLSYFAQMSADSLTQTAATRAFRAEAGGLRFARSAARRAYHAAFRRWHAAIQAGRADPFLPFPPPPTRPFPAPPEILAEPPPPQA
jgi:hypothetical protein